MKLHAKEIIKNKADKMVDLIIDEIGREGEKRLNASFVDQKTKVKYIISLRIESGAPEAVMESIDEEEIPAKIEDILTRLVALEVKEDQDTIYDDDEIQQRLSILEQRTDNDTVYDDSGLKARIRLLENDVEELKGSVIGVGPTMEEEEDEL